MNFWPLYERLDAGHVSSEKFRDFSPKSITIEDRNNHISKQKVAIYVYPT